MIIDSLEVRDYLGKAYGSSMDEVYDTYRDLALNSGYFDFSSPLDIKFSSEGRNAMVDIMGNVEEQILLTPFPNERFKNLSDLKERLVWFKSHLVTKKQLLVLSINEYKDNASGRHYSEPPSPILAAISVIDKFIKSTETALNLKDLKEQVHAESSVATNVVNIISRFSVCLRTLELERRKDAGISRPTLNITDEYDVQDILAAMLKLNFDDVRREEPIPSNGPSKTRCDLFLASHGIFIEIKTTLKKTVKEIFDDFKSDIPDYLKHPGCKSLVLFTYDPKMIVTNRRQFDELLKIRIEGSEADIYIAFS